jgi:hypothetical protein
MFGYFGAFLKVVYTALMSVSNKLRATVITRADA